MRQQSFNPYLPAWEHVPDVEPHVFGSRLYVYGSHDRLDGTAYCQLPYVCWSAPVDDLGSWTCHGVVYDGKQDPLNVNGERLLFAPDCIEAAGKYYLYYGLDDTSNAISVAMAEQPEGPFVFYGHVRHADGSIWGLRAGDRQQFDPAVFRDDDGTVYLYSGFSATPSMVERISRRYDGTYSPERISMSGNVVVTLAHDMLTIVREERPVLPGVANSAGTGFEGHEYLEASSLRKFGDWYYLVYSSVNGHELCYAMSRYPDRDFRYAGVLHSNGGLGLSQNPTNYYANNHGSLIALNGRYYVFGHRHTNYRQYARQGVAEEVRLHSDGTFGQAEMTSFGLNGGPLRCEGTYGAYIACVLMSGWGACKMDVRMDRNAHPTVTQEGDETFITNMRDGAVAGFRYFDMRGLGHVAATVRTDCSGRLRVRTTMDGDDICNIELAACADWVTYQGDASCEDGVHPLYFIYEGLGSMDFRDFTLEPL